MEDTRPAEAGLDDWEAGGVISFEQAETIRESTRRGPAWPDHRLIELLAYLGAAAFTIGAFIWYADLAGGDYWQESRPWGAFAVSLIAALALAGVAYVLRNDRGGIRRATGLLLALAVLETAFAITAFFEAIEFEGQWASLVFSLLLTAAAFGAWRLRASVPTEVALFASASTVVTAVIGLIEEASFDPMALDPGSITGITAGILLWLLGALWIRLGYRSMLRSANTAYLLGGATMLGASVGLMLGVNRWWIVLIAVTTVAIGASGVYLRRTMLLVIGTAGALITPALAILSWVGDPPVMTTWAMIYGIPGLILLGAALFWAERTRTAD